MYPYAIYKIDNKLRSLLIQEGEETPPEDGYIKYLKEDKYGEELEKEFYIAFDYNTLLYGMGEDEVEALQNLLEKLNPEEEDPEVDPG